MEGQHNVYFFAYTDEAEQVSQLYDYLTERGAKMNPLGDDRLSNLLEVIKGSKVLAGNNDGLEEAFNSILSVLVSCPVDDVMKLISAWSDVVLSPEFVGAGWQSSAGIAVLIFSNLFQFYDQDASLKFFVYKVMLEMAGRAKVTKSIDTGYSTIQHYFADWKLSVEQQRELLRILHVALLADNRGRDAAEVMTRLLRTYTSADAAAAVKDARECVRTAIVDPQTYSFDHLLRIHAIQQLEKSDPLIFQLLKIFGNGSLSEFKQFIKQHSDFVENDLKYNQEDLMKKVQILTLISLAEVNRSLSYDTLLKALDISSEEEIERFLIDALQSKAISGKLNGVRKEFNVTAFERRSFDLKEWTRLRERLVNLLENLKNAKTNVDLAANPTMIDEHLHYI